MLSAELEKTLLLDQARRLLRQLRTTADTTTDTDKRQVLRDAIGKVADTIRDLEAGL